jgi:hypothetical protein
MTQDLTPEAVAARIDALRRATPRFDILDCETALQVCDTAEALAAKLAEVEAEKREMAMPSLADLGQALDVYEAKLAAEAEVARLRDYLSSCVAMIQHAIGEGKDVFIEPDTKRRLSDARAALQPKETDHE